MSYFINQQSNDLPPYAQMNPKIRDLHDEAACIAQMLDPELCENDKELSIDIGLAYTVASHVGHNPSMLFDWLRNALIECDIDINEHPVNGLLQICQGFFEHEEILADIEEEQELDTKAVKEQPDTTSESE